MNPIEILYCWQAVVVAVVATLTTTLIKSIIDVVWGKTAPEPTPGVKEMAKIGMMKRKGTLVLNRIVIPGIPIVAGALFSSFVPLHPDVIVEYVSTNGIEGIGKTAIFAGWGAGCGQFADYTWTKIMAFYKTAKDKKADDPPADGNEG